MARPILDDIAWHTLSGAHRRHAVGDEHVRRYGAGFAPIAAFANPEEADLARLSRLFVPGETAFIPELDGAVRSRGWRHVGRTSVQQMVWVGSPRPQTGGSLDVMPLQPMHERAMTALMRHTPLGASAPRALELGRFYGVFEGDRLVAMAGQRMRARGFVELSSICTLDSHRRRGLARALIARQLADGVAPSEMPFLHVAEDNHGAIALYESMGFRRRRRVVMTTLCRVEDHRALRHAESENVA